MKESREGFSQNILDSQKIIEGFRANPLTQSLWHFLEPTLQEVLPTLMNEQSSLIAKANKRLDAMHDEPDDVFQASKEKFRINIIAHMQKKCMELVQPAVMKAVLNNGDKAMNLSPQHEQMFEGLVKGQVSSEFVREAGSVAKSVIVATAGPSDPQVDLFIDTQLKQSSSNFSLLVRETINKYLRTKTFDPTLRFNCERMREVLTSIFLDELTAQCTLLSKSDKPALDDDSESEDKFLEISLHLTDEASSSYKVIIQAAEEFAKSGPEMSQRETHQLMTKTHLALHQALEKEEPNCFEAKSPRSAKNRYFCRWSKEEDVTTEGFKLTGN